MKKLDLDRIHEDEENFLDTDKKRALALDRRKLKPKILDIKSEIFVVP